MDESLFTTRQLTNYRKWPTGEHGCLFYIAEAPTDGECFQGAVYLIDAEYRKDDKVGSYNILHQSEINVLPTIQPIVKGFAAFLFTQESTKWLENRNILDEWWKQYYQWCMNKRPRSGFETEYILCECNNWTLRKKELISCFLLNPNIEYLYKDAMIHVIRDVLFRYTEPVQYVLSRWHPFIVLPQTDPSSPQNCYMQYEYYTNAMKSEKGIFVSGMQAMLMQFSVVHHLVQEAASAQNLDKLIDFLLGKLGNNPQRAYTLRDIRNPNFSYQVAEKKLYEISLKLNRERLEPIFQRDTTFYLLPQKEQELGFINYLCREELKHFCQNNITEFLTKDEAHKMRNLIVGYFSFLNKKLEGSRYELRMRAELEKIFPEMKPKYNNPVLNETKQKQDDPVQYLILPEVGNYNALVRYVSERRKIDPEFASQLDNKSTYKAKCTFLKSIVGWLPNDNSLEHNLKARLKKGQDTGGLTFFPTR